MRIGVFVFKTVEPSKAPDESLRIATKQFIHHTYRYCSVAWAGRTASDGLNVKRKVRNITSVFTKMDSATLCQRNAEPGELYVRSPNLQCVQELEQLEAKYNEWVKPL